MNLRSVRGIQMNYEFFSSSSPSHVSFIQLQVELERLNTATDNINKYELELDVSVELKHHNIKILTQSGVNPSQKLSRTSI